MTDVRLTATNPEDSSVVPVACNEKGELKLEEPITFDGNLNGDLNVTGGAEFAGAGMRVLNNGTLEVGDNGQDLFTVNATNGATMIYTTATIGAGKITLNFDGSVSFAGATAGFTAEGNLFCTTTRGELVVLETLVNGLGQWSSYVPSSRQDKLDAAKDELSEKLGEWSEKDNSAES